MVAAPLSTGVTMVMGGSAPAVTRGQPSIRLLHLGFSLLTLIPERMGGSETNVRGLLGAFAAGEGPERVTVLANRHVVAAYRSFARGPVALHHVRSYRPGNGAVT